MEWLCGSAPEKNVQFHVNFNWFSSEIDRDYNISSERFLILDVLEDSIHAGIDKRKLLVAILITLRRSEEKNCSNQSMVLDLFSKKEWKKESKWKTHEQTKSKWKHLKRTFHLSHLIEIPAVDNETWNWCLKSCKWNFDWEQRIDDDNETCMWWKVTTTFQYQTVFSFKRFEIIVIVV